MSLRGFSSWILKVCWTAVNNRIQCIHLFSRQMSRIHGEFQNLACDIIFRSRCRETYRLTKRNAHLVMLIFRVDSRLLSLCIGYLQENMFKYKNASKTQYRFNWFPCICIYQKDIGIDSKIEMTCTNQLRVWGNRIQLPKTCKPPVELNCTYTQL